MSESSEPVAPPRATTLTPYEAEATATLGYLYGYPLVLMDVSRASWPVPANRFSHAQEFPDDRFTDVVSPNVDTLYSVAWLDLAKQPIVLGVPDVGRRYYMMQLLDAWTNVFAAPGTRTTGNGKGAFAIIGPDWRGEVPFGVEAIQAPTNMVWLLGRTYTAGKRDYESVHAIQREYQLVPLTAWAKAAERAAAIAPLGSTAEPPVSQVDKLAAGPFFARLAEAMKGNPPADDDEPLVRRLGELGIAPGAAFDLAHLPPSIVDAIEAGVAAARARLRGAALESLGKMEHGWRVRLDLGHYGTNYEQRAAIAMMGLGANLAADAVYPGTDIDAGGQPLSGQNRYVLRFPPGELPPVKAFWSVTMYNENHSLVANPLARYALGDRDPMRAADDGTLEICIQHDDPGPEWRANWLPAPAGDFKLGMRLYFPKQAVLDGRWRPPPVERL
jgi:hypothetical protein